MVPEQRRARAAVVPLREPPRSTCAPACARTCARATSRRCSRRTVQTPVRSEPHIALEEVDPTRSSSASPRRRSRTRDGPRLADEILAAIAVVTRDDEDEPCAARRVRPAPPRRPTPITHGVRRLALVALAVRRTALATSLAPSRRWTIAAELGRERRRTRRRARRLSGATSTSARSRSIARTTARGDVVGGLGADAARQLDARVVEHARVADEARGRRSRRRRRAAAGPRAGPWAKPRRPNFVAA